MPRTYHIGKYVKSSKSLNRPEQPVACQAHQRNKVAEILFPLMLSAGRETLSSDDRGSMSRLLDRFPRKDRLGGLLQRGLQENRCEPAKARETTGQCRIPDGRSFRTALRQDSEDFGRSFRPDVRLVQTETLSNAIYCSLRCSGSVAKRASQVIYLTAAIVDGWFKERRDGSLLLNEIDFQLRAGCLGIAP